MSVHRLSRAAVKFQVGITYCDGTSFAHDYEGKNAVHESVKEYAAMIAEALEPSLTDAHARHVRLVTFLGFDKDHLPIHHIHSGLFPCEHARGD